MNGFIWNSTKVSKPDIYQDYLVIVAEKYPSDQKWEFHVDVATPEFLKGDEGYIEFCSGLILMICFLTWICLDLFERRMNKNGCYF